MITIIHRVDVDIPEDLHSKYHQSFEYDTSIIEATKGCLESGSYFSHTAVVWATFGSLVEAKVAEINLLEVVELFEQRAKGVFPFSITLSLDMRTTIDGTGSWGVEVRKFLAQKCEWFPANRDWDMAGDIVFGLPENTLHEFISLVVEEIHQYQSPLFSCIRAFISDHSCHVCLGEGMDGEPGDEAGTGHTRKCTTCDGLGYVGKKPSKILTNYRIAA